MIKSPQLELVTPTAAGPRSRLITLGTPIAKGAAGTVYHLQGDPATVIKIYHDTIKPSDLRTSQLQVEAMLRDPPDLPPYVYENENYVQIAWPTGLVFKNKKFVGFSMPALQMNRTKVLEFLLLDRQAAQQGLRSDMGTRVTVARQLAGVVAQLHQKGHYVVDMKPVNLSYYPKTLYMAVLDCDGFNIHDQTNDTSYPAPMFTEEYLAPEFQDGGNPNADPPAQDKFALAVIIFQLLCHGTHPFSGVLRDKSLSSQRKDYIVRGDFPYGRTPRAGVAPVPSCTYRCLPDELLECFERAFGNDPARRPSAQRWTNLLDKYATPSTNNLVRCRTNPEHRHFAGLPCSRCSLDRILAGMPPLVTPISQPQGGATSTPPPVPTPRSISTPPAMPAGYAGPMPPPIPTRAIGATAPPIMPLATNAPGLSVRPAAANRSGRNTAIGFGVVIAAAIGGYFGFTDHAGFNSLFTDTAASTAGDAQPATTPAPAATPAADAQAAASAAATDAAAAANAAASAADDANTNKLAAARQALGRGQLLVPQGAGAIDLAQQAWDQAPSSPDARQLIADVLKGIVAQETEALASNNQPLATLYAQRAEALASATVGLTSPEWQTYLAAQPPTMAAAAPGGAATTPTSVPLVTATPGAAGGVNGVIQVAERGDWTAADAQVAALAQQAPVVAPGDRKSARALNAQGLTALNGHDYAGAIKAFTDAQAADPADIEVSNNLGAAYQQAGQNGQAIQQLERTLLRAPVRASAWENLAHVYAQLGNAAAAEACARLTLRYSRNQAKTITYMSSVVSANPDGVYEKILSAVLRDQSTPAAPATASGFAVQVTAFRTESEAITLRDKLRAAGFSAYSERVQAESGTLFRVRIGPAATLDAADHLRIDLNSRLGLSGMVVADLGPASPPDAPRQGLAGANPNQDAPPPQNLDSAINAMLAEGQSCFANKNYSCAITSANNALRLNANHAGAKELKDRAEAAQSEAMRNIDIH